MKKGLHAEVRMNRCHLPAVCCRMCPTQALQCAEHHHLQASQNASQAVWMILGMVSVHLQDLPQYHGDFEHLEVDCLADGSSHNPKRRHLHLQKLPSYDARRNAKTECWAALSLLEVQALEDPFWFLQVKSMKIKRTMLLRCYPLSTQNTGSYSRASTEHANHAN